MTSPCTQLIIRHDSDVGQETKDRKLLFAWASYQIRKSGGCACAGNAGKRFPRHRLHEKPRVSDPGMQQSTCATTTHYEAQNRPRIHRWSFYCIFKSSIGFSEVLSLLTHKWSLEWGRRFNIGDSKSPKPKKLYRMSVDDLAAGSVCCNLRM